MGVRDHTGRNQTNGRCRSSLPPPLTVVWLGLMSTLAEIEAAAEALSPEQKQELMLFLAARLRANGAKMPEPRAFSPDEIANWIARDETDLARFNAKT